MKKNIIKITILSTILIPAISFAQQKDLNYLVKLFVGYLNVAVYLIMALAMLMFVWNVYKYFIYGSDDVSSKKDAGLYVMWSVIGFFVILSFWGLVNILKNSLKLDDNMPSSGIFGNFKSSGSGSIFSPNTMGGANNTGPNTMGGANNIGPSPAGGGSTKPYGGNNPVFFDGSDDVGTDIPATP